MEKDDESDEQRKNSNIVSILRNFFQSIGLRCTTQMVDGLNRELLVFNFYFLPCISLILYTILLIR